MNDKKDLNNKKEDNKDKNDKKNQELIKLIQKLRSKKKKYVSHNSITLFYEKPHIFFQNYKQLLEKTTAYDSCGTSIITHYFYILYEKYKKTKKITDGQNPPDIYDTNFNSFFTENKKFLLMQDSYLDTPLHKIARLRDKEFFILICKKLIDINILDEEMLTKQNYKGENIYRYIFNDICNNYLLLIGKNDSFDYKSILSHFTNLNNSLTLKEKKFMTNFNLGIKLEYIKFKDGNFNSIYAQINDANNNILLSFINEYFTNGINYFNYLYQLCNENEDYNKLFELICKLIIREKSLESCIYNHLGYALRKMNSTKKKGNKEINYGINLLNFILKKNIKYKEKRQIYKILCNRIRIWSGTKNSTIFEEGIVYDVLYNQNINFDKKSEILDTINKILNILNIEIENEIDHEIINIYTLFKLFNENNVTKSNIVDIYENNLFMKETLIEFLPYLSLYEFINMICDKNDKKNYNDFINIVNTYLSNKYNNKYYEIRFGFSDNNQKKILEILLFIIEQYYNKNNNSKNGIIYDSYILFNNTINEHRIKKELFLKNKFIFENLKYRLIMSNQQITILSLKYLCKNKSDNKDNKELLFDILFNSKYDLTNFIDEYKTDIITVINNESKESKESEESKNKITINIKKTINLKNVYYLFSFIKDYQKAFEFFLVDSPSIINKEIKKNNFPIICYSFIFYLYDELNDYKILTSNRLIYNEIHSLTINSLYHFINDWDKPYDYSTFINLIESNLLFFCRFLINSSDTPEENTDKINFLFDLMNELKPGFTKQYEDYIKISIECINSKPKNNPIDWISFKDFTLKEFYFILILIYANAKFGENNPELLFSFTFIYENYKKNLIMFMKCINENKNDNSIKYHFFLAKYNTIQNNINYLNYFIKRDWKMIYECKLIEKQILHNIKIYFSKYLSDLKDIKHSLVFEYITKIITDLNLDTYYRERRLLIPSMILYSEQNERIINIIITKMISGQISFYEFLTEEYSSENENNFRKIIYNIVKELNKRNKNDFVESNNSNKFLINENFNKKNFILNLHQLFVALNKKSINLFECVKSNYLLLNQTFYMLQFAQKWYHLGIKEIILFKQDVEMFFFSQIYDFLVSYCLLCKDDSNNLNLKQIKDNEKIGFHMDVFTNVFYIKIKKLGNKKSINIEYEKYIEFMKFYFLKHDEHESQKSYYKKIVETDFKGALKKILIFFAINIPENCISLIKFICEFFDFYKDYTYLLLYDIIIYIIEKDLNKNKIYIKDFISLVKDISNNNDQSQEIASKIKENDLKYQTKAFIINYLLRNTEYCIQINLKTLYPILLNKIKDKKMIEYFIYQVRTSNQFLNDENILVLFLEKCIQNDYAFDCIINLMSEEKQKIFFETLKDKIIKSLFLYGQINAYVQFQKLIKLICHFGLINEVRKAIYPLKNIEEEITKSVNYLNEEIDNDFFKPKDKYLFHYCHTKKIIENYEIIAILFEYCPKTEAILDIFPFFNYNVEELTIDLKMRKYLLYFKNEKNRKLIKELSSSFYDFSLFLEIFFEQLNNIKDKAIERQLFFYYIQIHVLECTPKELLIFFDFELFEEEIDYQNYEDWFIDELLKRRKKRAITEHVLFIIFAFYEFKGIPIISIKKYLPKFYSKAESYYKIFKKLKFPNFCIKRPFDIKIYEKLKFIIDNKTDKLITHLYSHYSVSNLIFLIEKEKNKILDLSTDNNYLVKVIYNILENNQLENQINDNNYEDFLKGLRKSFGITNSNDSNDNNLDSSYSSTRFTEKNSFDDLSVDNDIFGDLIKYCIITLKNFNLNASILIEQCSKKNFYLDKYNYFKEFIAYLRIILNICNHIISLSVNENYETDNYFINGINLFNDTIFGKYNEKFKEMKNTIDIKQINNYILMKYENQEINNNDLAFFFINNNENNSEEEAANHRMQFFNIFKDWLKYYYESAEYKKLFNDLNKEKFTYITYFKYMKLVCTVILNFLMKINEVNNIRIFEIKKKYNKKIIKLENVNFVFDRNKNKIKNLFSKSLYNLGEEVLKIIKKEEEEEKEKILKDNNNNHNHNINKKYDKINYQTEIIIGYYYNEEKNEFLETVTDIPLLEFYEKKMLCIKEFIQHLYIKELITYITKKNKNKNKKKKKDNIIKVPVYRSEIIDINDCLNENGGVGKSQNLLSKKCNKEKINNLLKIFYNYKEYQNIICSYLEKTAENIYEPKLKHLYYNALNLKNLYYDYAYPYIYINQCFTQYCKNLDLFCGDKYDIFVDYCELYQAIKDTIFHENQNLNKFFQKCAINFIIKNDNSLINIFINEIYKLIHDEMFYKQGKIITIKNKFKITIKKGYTYNSKNKNDIINEINNLLCCEDNKKNNKDNIINNDNKNNINNKKIKNKEKPIILNDINNISGKGPKKIKLKCITENKDNKLKLNITEDNNNNEINGDNRKMNKNIVIKNRYKRKNIPIASYEGYIPTKNTDYINNVGKSKCGFMKFIFGNEILIENIPEKNYLDNLGKKEKLNKGKKIIKEVHYENKINIFNSIFKIGSLRKTEIILYQYDISQILEPFLEEKKFLDLINKSFYDKTKVDIPKNWSKFLDLSFIYIALGYH